MKDEITGQKLRGQKRYFINLESRILYNLKHLLNWYQNEGWSFDKIRVDNFGYRTLKARRLHLKCLIDNYLRLNHELNNLDLEFQAWIWLEEFSGYEDCIIIHSKNEFTHFPHVYGKSYSLNKENHLTDRVLHKLTDEVNLLNRFTIRYGNFFTTEEIDKPLKKCLLEATEIKNSVFHPIKGS